jgi:hypothetical protein
MKKYTHVCANTAFAVELQKKVCELNLSTTSCPTIILENTLKQCIKNVVMVTLTTGIVFLLLTSMHFKKQGTLRRWSASAPTAYEVVRDC